MQLKLKLELNEGKKELSDVRGVLNQTQLYHFYEYIKSDLAGSLRFT